MCPQLCCDLTDTILPNLDGGDTLTIAPGDHCRKS
jgi:hypothetical protein